MQAPEVSILILTWNADRYVTEAVESGRVQSLKDLEVLKHHDPK